MATFYYPIQEINKRFFFLVRKLMQVLYFDVQDLPYDYIFHSTRHLHLLKTWVQVRKSWSEKLLSEVSSGWPKTLNLANRKTDRNQLQEHQVLFNVLSKIFNYQPVRINDLQYSEVAIHINRRDLQSKASRFEAHRTVLLQEFHHPFIL